MTLPGSSDVLLTTPEVRVGPVTWAGTQFEALLALDPTVVEERLRTGLGAVTTYSVIETLESLPRGIEVPWGEMTQQLRTRIQTLDFRVVERSGSGATAKLSPPCEPLSLWSRGRSWRKITAVAPLTQYAPVSVVLSRKPRSPEPALAAARRTGVGVVLSRTPTEWLPVVPPKRRVRLSTGRTRFVEVLFAAWLRTISVGSPGRHASEAEPGLQLF